MFVGHSHISGHSGTAQKHRKAFEMVKERNKTKKINRNIDPTKEDKPSDRKVYGVSNTDKKVRQRITLSIIFISLVVIGIPMSKYQKLPYKSTPVLSRVESDVLKIEKPKSPRLYNLLLKSGDLDLKNNKLDKAQSKFAEAIELYPLKKTAQIGFAKALKEQCKQNNLYCSEAEVQLAYLKKMNYSIDEKID